MPRRKVDPKFAVKNDSIKVAGFPVHDNTAVMSSKLADDGRTVVFTPPDEFCSVKVNGYFNDGKTFSGYEVVAKRYEKIDSTQWGRGKTWKTAGYVRPYTFQVHWILRSQWLSDMLGVLVKDIQNYEETMKKRIMEGMK